MADMTPDERGMDAIGWFIKTPPDSEEQDLLCDIAAAIREAVEAREREIVEIVRRYEPQIVAKGRSPEWSAGFGDAARTIAAAIDRGEGE